MNWAISAAAGVLFYTDATASFGGNPLETDAWGRIRSPPGCRSAWAALPAVRRSPQHRLKIVRRRKCVEEGIRTAEHAGGDDEMIYSTISTSARSCGLLGAERLNHHTEATSMLFAARDARR